jgi:hypothetical protein
MEKKDKTVISALVAIPILVSCFLGAGYTRSSWTGVTKQLGPRIVDIANGDEDLIIYGRTEGDDFGFSATFGDINGDGRKDLIVGARRSDGRGEPTPAYGEVDVFFGRRRLPQEIDLQTENPDIIIFGSPFTGELGCAVASGDLNGDGIDDLIMAACQGRNPDSPTVFGGELIVIFGKRSWPQEIYLGDPPGDVVIYGGLGRDLALGDINADGKDDLLVGNGCSRLYIFFGKDLFPPVIDLTYVESDALIETIDFPSCGQKVAVGDLNADGVADAILSEYRAQGWRPGLREQGEVYVIYGRNPFPTLVDLRVEEPDVRIRGADTGDEIGMSLASGDVNGDHIDDLIIGSWEFLNKVYIFFGGPNMRPLVDLYTDSPDVGIISPDARRFARDLATGDMDGDGIEDLFISAPNANGMGWPGYYCGEVYGFSGRPAWPPVLNLSIDTPEITVYGADMNDGIGWAIDAADLNADGSSDLVIGAFCTNGPMNDRECSGEVYVVLGPELIPQLTCESFDDLDETLLGAAIDNQGVRNSLDQKSDNARHAFDRGQIQTSGNILCAMIHEVRAQTGKHIEPASADAIILCIRDLAQALGIPIDCSNDEESDEQSDEDSDLPESLVSLRSFKDGRDVVFFWQGGTPPYRVLISNEKGGPFETSTVLQGNSTRMGDGQVSLFYFKVE